MSNREPPTYLSHPLYPLRRILIINATIGILFLFLTSDTVSYRVGSELWPIYIFALIVSGGLSALDLFASGYLKREIDLERNNNGLRPVCPQCRLPVSLFHHNDLRLSPEQDRPQYTADNKDDDNIWPMVWIMVLEFFVILGLACLLSGQLIYLFGGPYEYNSPRIVGALQAYSSVFILVAMILHANCWWKAYREKEKQKWRKQEVHNNNITAPSTTTQAEQNRIICHCVNNVVGEDHRLRQAPLRPTSWLDNIARAARNTCSFNQQVQERQPLLVQQPHQIQSTIPPEASTTLVSSNTHTRGFHNCHCHCYCHCPTCNNHQNATAAHTQNILNIPVNNDSEQSHHNHESQSSTTANITDLSVLDLPAQVMTPSTITPGTDTSHDDQRDGDSEYEDTIRPGLSKSGTTQDLMSTTRYSAKVDPDDEEENTAIMAVRKGKRKVGRRSETGE